MPRRIGVLALQGGYDPHARCLKALRAQVTFVRKPEDLQGLEALVIPGGESTTIGKLLVLHGLLEPLRGLIAQGFPVFGTCAGMILLSREVPGSTQTLLGGMDMTIRRNAYGRQIESFEAQIPWDQASGGKIPGIFIRAPQILDRGPEVKVLASFENLPVLVQQGRLLAASFHPELTANLSVHRYFLSLIQS